MNLINYWFWFKRNPFRSREDLKKIQFALLKNQITNAYKNSLFYKEIWDEGNFHPSQLISLNDMQRIPVISKKDFKRVHPKEITVKKDLSALHIHRTSGSTGIPLEIYFDHHDLMRKNFMWFRAYLMAGMKLTSRNLVMCDPVDIREHFWFEKIGILRSDFINVFNDPNENFKRIAKNNFNIMVGYPIDLRMISKIIIDNKIKVTPDIVFSSAELLDKDTRVLIEKAFNAPVCDFYGSTEGGCVAFQIPKSDFYYVPSDITYLEVKSGEEIIPVNDATYGEAIITNLWNQTFPVIRYNIGDFIEIDQNIDSNKSFINFPRISRIVGKYLDFLVFPNNEIVSPHKVKQLLTDLPAVDSFQVYQEKLSEIEIRVAINRQGNFENVENEVQKRLKNVFPETVTMFIKQVESFNRNASRKFKVIESKIGQQYFDDEKVISDRIKMFAPGPVNVTRKVMKSLLVNDIGHREPKFEEIFREVTTNLLKIFKASSKNYSVVLTTGSGTCANETVLSSIDILPKKTLVISNGEFGERLVRQANLFGHDVIHLKYEWGSEFNLKDIKSSNLSEIGLVCIVGLETSTGVVNPVKQIGEIIKSGNSEILYFVDAVSALGAEDIDTEDFHIDFCSSSAGKAIAALPGLSMICLRNNVIESRLTDKRKIGYLNLFALYDYKKRLNQTPHTPAIQLITGLNVAVKEYLEIGELNYKKQYSECSKLLFEGLIRMGIKPFIPNFKVHSRVVSSFYLPDNLTFFELKTRLFEKGYLIYGGKKYLEEKRVFQVANMGHITIQDCFSFLEAFKKSINGK